ncbi:hypothetical protein WJX72_008098 [[Myrmecia] bisecta]|uniref:C2 domain-containing protein n=1 Tax=[Myrmecia] bisecta TaxID=41462 RepID=A0AAW1QRQ4_9CHLO
MSQGRLEVTRKRDIALLFCLKRRFGVTWSPYGFANGCRHATTKAICVSAVLGATGLRDTQTFGKQDPYAVLQVGNLRFRTKTCADGGKKPIWNETFHFDVPAGVTELQCVVWNDNTVTSDDTIGSAHISLAKALSEKHDHARIPLKTNDGKSAGELDMFMDFTPAKVGDKPMPQPIQQGATIPAKYPTAPPADGAPPLYGQPQYPPPAAPQYGYNVQPPQYGVTPPQYGYPQAPPVGPYYAQPGAYPPPAMGQMPPQYGYPAPGGQMPYGAPPPQY